MRGYVSSPSPKVETNADKIRARARKNTLARIRALREEADRLESSLEGKRS